MKEAILLTPGNTGLLRQQRLVQGFELEGWSVRPFEGWRGRHAPDIGISSGMRNNSLVGRKFCQAQKIPVVIVELGYVKRSDSNADTEGYFQLGWNRIGWIPEGPVSSDRWDALGLEVLPDRTDGEYILVLGQVGYDAQHNLSTFDLSSQLLQLARSAQQLHKKPVVYRPHPNQPNTRFSAALPHSYQKPGSVSLDEALSKAAAVVAYNSTAGVEAVRQGIPVVCSAKAHYAAVGRSREERLAYFHRLAYAQWKLEELADGSAVRFLMSRKPA